MKIRVKLKTKKKQALISYTERIFIKQLTEREKERESSKQKKMVQNLERKRVL